MKKSGATAMSQTCHPFKILHCHHLSKGALGGHQARLGDIRAQLSTMIFWPRFSFPFLELSQVLQIWDFWAQIFISEFIFIIYRQNEFIDRIFICREECATCLEHRPAESELHQNHRLLSLSSKSLPYMHTAWLMLKTMPPIISKNDRYHYLFEMWWCMWWTCDVCIKLSH